MTFDLRAEMDAPRQRMLGVCVLLGWCVILLAAWVVRAREPLAIGLLWNLCLATVPLFWSTGLRTASERGNGLGGALCFFLWLLFLPNAPYLLTDLIHLAPRPHAPQWFQLATLLSCAGAGTLLGYLSLLDVHAVVEQKFGQLAGWAVAVGSLGACGFGMYIGRFLRWNSWDAVTNPLRLVRSVAGQFIDPGPHPHPLAVTLIFGLGLLVGYLALRVFSTPETI